ncbi:hypothetical protein [Pseudonocardia sp.]|uniref:hypothetical protein n=1 Tax=Pseudonocardia sp. TaxID=60912 RepID=UPI002604FD9A|nr:hypothetical protein [Pseudonocardia sp.]
MTAMSAVLQELLRLPGATYSCVLEHATGQLLVEAGRDAGDAATVLRWGRSATEFLAADGDELDDVMMTSRRAYHLVRRIVGETPQEPLLVYLCLDRNRSNLALARRELAQIRVPRPAPDPAPEPGDAAAHVASTAQMPAREPAALPRRVPAPVPPPPPPVPMPALVRRVPAPVRPAAAAQRPRPWPGSVPEAPPVVPAQREGGPGDPVPAGYGPVAGPRWADDVGTLRRLLAGLKALR